MTAIEWTNETWNPTVGCTPVSEGCRHCFAAREALRLAGNPNPKVAVPYEGTSTMKGVGRGRHAVFTGEVRTLHERLSIPLRWRKPRLVFVDSMSDLFHPDVPDDFIHRVFAVMAASMRHTFQILTKRPERAAWFLHTKRHASTSWYDGMSGAYDAVERYARAYPTAPAAMPWPLPNVWIGTSVESQDVADRVGHLLRTPAAVRFVSAEPLIGPLDLTIVRTPITLSRVNSLSPNRAKRVDWVIVGGESGPNARRCRVGWIRNVVRDCVRNRVPVFVKQLGSRAVVDLARGSTGIECEHGYDVCPQCDAGSVVPVEAGRKGSDIGAWPADLRVREMPEHCSVAP